MGYCTVDDICSAFPQFNRNAPGSISDDRILGWIEDRKARIRSAFLTRGTDPDTLPHTPDQAAFLRSLNRDGAAADLADSLQSNVTLQPGEMSLGAMRRQAFERVIAEITKGQHDRLFRADARTADVAPQLGGTAGGETDPNETPADRGQNKAFGKGQMF
jgi:hypothetical protein